MPVKSSAPCLSSLLRLARRAALFGSLTLLTATSAIVLPTITDRAAGPRLTFADRVMAQDADQAILDNDEVFTRYVRAAVTIEKQRQSMMAQVKDLTGGEVPTNNVCGNIDKFAAEIQEPVRAICVSYSRYVAATAYQKYKLTKEEFNAFQRRVRNPEMRQRIDQKIQELELK
jgi:hypothetical protein